KARNTLPPKGGCGVLASLQSRAESVRRSDYTPSPNRQWVRGPKEVVAGLRPCPAMTGVRGVRYAPSSLPLLRNSIVSIALPRRALQHGKSRITGLVENHLKSVSAVASTSGHAPILAGAVYMNTRLSDFSKRITGCISGWA